MGTADGAPLDSLTAKVEELGRMCARLSQQNAELRAQVSSLNGGTARRDAPGARGGQEGTVTRRVLGKALVAGAAGVVGGAALAAQPAAASSRDAVVAGETTTAEARTAVLYDGSSGFGGVVLLGNDSTYDGGNAAFPAALGGWAGAGGTAGSGGVPSGIYGFTDNGSGYGVVGVNSTAVGSGGSGVLGMVSDARNDAVTGINTGTGGEAIAVHGVITNAAPSSAGVRAENRTTSVDGFAVWASHNGGGIGVLAEATSGIGVRANGGSGTGVLATGTTVGVTAIGGTTAVQATGATAVLATGSGGTGIAVSAQVNSTEAAVSAANTGSGPAVIAANSGSGPGVRGSSTSGRGGVFFGTAAQVQLVPGAGSTHPKGGKQGDLYADKTGRLWFCKKGGSTATWHQIA